VELLQLRYFYESAKNENFSKTAEIFMVPTTSVSASIRRLEEELGCPLEVRVKIFTGAKVYDSNGTEYEVQYVYENEFMAADGTCDDNGIDNEYHFLFNEYNQFWWLDNGEKSE
jgi:hypothetical protein